jgi:hypothetical protein
MTSEQQSTRAGLTRREAMARALKTGAYAAPVLLSASALASHVGASPPPALTCAATTSFVQDVLFFGVAAGATFNVYAQPNTSPTPTLLGVLVADALGVAPGAFTFTIPSSATSVTLSVFLAPGAPPDLAAATFVSSLAGALTCTPGGPRAAALLVAKVIQEATGCPVGTPTAWLEQVDVNLVNAAPNTVYDVYIRPNNVVGGAFVLAGMLPPTNAQGNTGKILPVTVATTGAAPTAVTVNVVPTGMPATAAGAFTFAAGPTGNPTTSTLFTVSCTGAITALNATRPILISAR